MSSNTNPYVIATGVGLGAGGIGGYSGGAGGAGASGSIYNLGAGANSTSYINNVNAAITITDGTTMINSSLQVNGRDVMAELDELRDAVLLLKRHVDMEAKYPKLKELKDEYERALAKYKTFDAIKESK
jgi:hypothetical protein